MTLSRRGFLGGILAAAAAPALVRASSLMPIVAPKIWTMPPDNLCAKADITITLPQMRLGDEIRITRGQTKYFVTLDELGFYEATGPAPEILVKPDELILGQLGWIGPDPDPDPAVWDRINTMNVTLRRAHAERQQRAKPNPQADDLVIKRLRQLIGPNLKA